MGKKRKENKEKELKENEIETTTQHDVPELKLVTVIPNKNMYGIGEQFLKAGEKVEVPKWFAIEMKKNGQI